RRRVVCNRPKHCYQLCSGWTGRVTSCQGVTPLRSCLLWSVIVPKNADLIWCRSLQRNERHTFVAVVIIQVLRLDYKQLFFSSSSIPTFSYRIHRQHTYSVKIACKQRTVNIQKERIQN